MGKDYLRHLLVSFKSRNYFIFPKIFVSPTKEIRIRIYTYQIRQIRQHRCVHLNQEICLYHRRGRISSCDQINLFISPKRFVYVYIRIHTHVLIFIQEICLYRVAKTHRIPYLYRSFSAKEPYI